MMHMTSWSRETLEAREAARVARDEYNATADAARARGTYAAEADAIGRAYTRFSRAWRRAIELEATDVAEARAARVSA